MALAAETLEGGDEAAADAPLLDSSLLGALLHGGVLVCFVESAEDRLEDIVQSLVTLDNLGVAARNAALLGVAGAKAETGASVAIGAAAAVGVSLALASPVAEAITAGEAGR